MKGTLVLLLVLFTALILIGCTAPPTEIETDEQLKITGFQQEVICGNTIYKTQNSTPASVCNPNSANYDCAACAIFSGCSCECCEECPDCPTCETCEECEECPTPTPCCCNLKWGDLYIYFSAGEVEVCVTITFEDLTTIEECFCIDGNGEAKITLTKPVQQVIFVELI